MKKIIFAVLFVILFLGFKTNAFAEKINSFDVSIVAHENGLMNVSETINYDFEELEKHGIYRYIPTFSKVGDLYRVIKIENINVERDGKKENFETTKTKEQIYFKIGDKNKTITGPHVYKISYTVENGIGSNFPEYDEIYWNATGNDWNVIIEKASIKFATDFGIESQELKCFTGSVGSVDSRCLVNRTNVISLASLNSGEGLTAVVKYPRGTFPPSILSKEPPKSISDKIMELVIGNYFVLWGILNVVLAGILFIWYQKKKHKKRFGSPVVNFDIPKDEQGNRLQPAIAGTIDSAELEKDDIMATLFDLAIRKYLVLSEEKVNKTLGLIGGGKKQKITKLKESDESFANFEKTLFNNLFIDGNEVYADDLKIGFYKTYQQMEKDVFTTLKKKKYFVRNPKISRGFLFIMGIILLVTLNFILGAVFIYLAVMIIGRTDLGDEIDFKIDGLKLFLKSMDRNYKWQAEKFYTVEQMIPYAMALGYIDKFMEQLKIIQPDFNPTWYHGSSGSFYSSYNGFYSSISTVVASGASGSSGGGSGGGGGGGGGGSW